MVESSGLAVELGGRRVLEGVDLSLREGETIALVGPNGSGKTTLLRAIAGTVATAAGGVSFFGRKAPQSVVERTAVAGYVPQDPSLAFFKETLADEVIHTLRQRGAPAEPRAVLENWGLDDLAGHYPRHLSVGQQERAAHAVMLAHGPKVWLLDEPSRGADKAAHDRLGDALRRHCDEGGAAIVATHDIESAARWATRVIGLEDGRIVFDLPVRGAFRHGGPLPTVTARLVPGAVLPEEVARC